MRELLGLYVVLRTSKTTVDSKDRSVFQTGATRLEPFIMCGEGGPEGAGTPSPPAASPRRPRAGRRGHMAFLCSFYVADDI